MNELKSKQSVLIESQYLPCIEYFVVLQSYDNVLLEVEEHYIKQSYRNRCRILTAHGPCELCIPIKHENRKMKMRDVKIDHQQKWMNQHWRSIKSAYGKAPFFEHFAESIKTIYDQKRTYLVDMNLEFFQLFQKLLSQSISLKKNQVYERQTPEGIQDWRSLIHPKKGLENNPIYKPCNYNQIFGKKFVGNLSIIDLLFCEGPGANNVLQKCRIID